MVTTNPPLWTMKHEQDTVLLGNGKNGNIGCCLCTGVSVATKTCPVCTIIHTQSCYLKSCYTQPLPSQLAMPDFPDITKPQYTAVAHSPTGTCIGNRTIFSATFHCHFIVTIQMCSGDHHSTSSSDKQCYCCFELARWSCSSLIHVTSITPDYILLIIKAGTLKLKIS